LLIETQAKMKVSALLRAQVSTYSRHVPYNPLLWPQDMILRSDFSTFRTHTLEYFKRNSWRVDSEDAERMMDTVLSLWQTTQSNSHARAEILTPSVESVRRSGSIDSLNSQPLSATILSLIENLQRHDSDASSVPQDSPEEYVVEATSSNSSEIRGFSSSDHSSDDSPPLMSTHLGSHTPPRSLYRKSVPVHRLEDDYSSPRTQQSKSSTNRLLDDEKSSGKQLLISNMLRDLKKKKKLFREERGSIE